MKPYILRVSCILLLVALNGTQSWAIESPAKLLSWNVVQEYPHDSAAFTQGLLWDSGVLYESTGLYGHSSLRTVNLASGRVIQYKECAPRLFAEGITLLGDTIYQLTWRNGLVLQYDKDTLTLRRAVSWPREGWGLTHNGRQLILSDGTAALSFLNPETLAEERRITVREGSREIERLNELEYVDGAIYANVWQECRIAVINPEDGRVTAWLDLAPLCQRAQRGSEDVLNGIASDPGRGSLLVTGKLWPAVFEIRIASER